MTTSIHAPEIDQSILANSVGAILNSTQLLSLATIKVTSNPLPWINTAYFAWDNEYYLYFLSDPNALHSKNIANNQYCAISVFNSQQTGDNGKAGLQIEGTCLRAEGNILERGLRAYQKRFSGFDKVIKEVDDFDKGIINAKLYAVSISNIKIFDEATFGEETWVSASIHRSA